MAIQVNDVNQVIIWWIGENPCLKRSAVSNVVQESELHIESHSYVAKHSIPVPQWQWNRAGPVAGEVTPFSA